MSLTVRFMRKQDIPQVVVIDRDAFPTEWPPTNFPRELENKMAHYIVVYKTAAPTPQAAGDPPVKENSSGLFDRVLRIFQRKPVVETPQPEQEDIILGFAGMWLLADEAHITSIASHKDHRREGIGEALLISLIEMAMVKHSRIVTLEARVSNQVAQNLYYKFGFDKLGLRKAYYLDNHEDAVIMSTEYIGGPPFQEQFRKVKTSCIQKIGSINTEQITTQHLPK
jgi:ribosomal-protein-alanine N-acetyltransferase